jgi:acetate---CoA ligase (ADP-forming)
MSPVSAGQPALPGPSAVAGPAPPEASVVTTERLKEFFAPRSIAVVGASDTSGWARFVAASAVATGFSGPLIPVHPVHRTVFGKPAVRSLADLAEPVDLAFVLAPIEAVESVLDDAAAAGVRGVIVLASGYREVGDEGRRRQDAMIARARSHGIVVLGPNCLGFLNAHARVGPFALTIPLPLLAGPVGIVLASGALASVVLAFARSRAIGVSTLTTIGNEAMISTADVLDYLIDDDHTRVICLFLEEISEPTRFARAAERAGRAGKPIVVLKVGSSPVGRQAALAHTGSVAGDDAVVGAALRQLNVIRVTSIEELLCTAALLGYDRWPRGRKMGVLTTSGGACDIIADRANAQGIEIPPFAPQTVTQITPRLPPFAAVRNPLDVTGYFLANRRTSALTAIDHALDAAVADPGLDFVLFAGVTLPDTRPPDEAAAGLLEERMAWLGKRIASAPVPVIPVGATCVDVTEYGRELLTGNGIHLLGGIDLGVLALGNALRWIEGVDRPRPSAASVFGHGRPAADDTGLRGTPAMSAAANQAEPSGRLWSEADARNLLAAHGVPVVPGELVNSADAAAATAGRLGFPVALKVCSAQISHKSDIGGVALGLRTEAEVRAGYEQVLASGKAVAGASIDGILVTAMRTGGVELLAGVTVDPTFGPVLAVGLGGVWVEVLGDTSLRVLPVDAAEVLRMLGELRGMPLLRGARGTRPAKLDALARVIALLGNVAAALDDDFRELEINPLWVNGDQIEALDVLVVTRRGLNDRSGRPRTERTT